MPPPTPTPKSLALPGQPIASSTQYLPGTGVHQRHDSLLTATIPGTIHIDNTTHPLPTLSILSPFASPSSSVDDAPTFTSDTSTTANATSPLPPTTTPLLLLPTVGSTILGRITRTNPRQASVDVFALYPTRAPTSTSTSTTSAASAGAGAASSTLPTSAVTLPTPLSLPTPFHATLRTQDIRATEKDRVKMATSYKPGDIIRATVIGLGDQQGGYLLSTGGNILGVVVAWREEGMGGGGVGGGAEGWGEPLVPKSWKDMMGVRSGVVEQRKVARPV